MKRFLKLLILVFTIPILSSCEINDEILERSDSSIYNKLKNDRENSDKTERQADDITQSEKES